MCVSVSKLSPLAILRCTCLLEDLKIWCLQPFLLGQRFKRVDCLWPAHIRRFPVTTSLTACHDPVKRLLLATCTGAFHRPKTPCFEHAPLASFKDYWDCPSWRFLRLFLFLNPSGLGTISVSVKHLKVVAHLKHTYLVLFLHHWCLNEGEAGGSTKCLKLQEDV